MRWTIPLLAYEQFIIDNGLYYDRSYRLFFWFMTRAPSTMRVLLVDLTTNERPTNNDLVFV